MSSHEKRAHAVCSASGSKQWLNCPPSVRLGEQFEEDESPFAREGTLAHEMAETKLNLFTGEINKEEFSARMEEYAKHELYTPDMPEEVDKYVDFVIEEFNQSRKNTKDAVLYPEIRVDFSDYVPEGFGTGDATLIEDSYLKIIDLKYGKGIQVDAKDNSQLMLYALGAIKELGFLGYKFKKVLLCIAQPRLNHFDTHVITVSKLIEWAEKTVKPRAELAHKGDGEFKAGDHCKWCKARVRCKTLSDYNLEMLKHDFSDPQLLEDDDLVHIRAISKQVTSWLESVNKYMTKEAKNGKTFKGLKLVEGKSNRVWADKDKVKALLAEKGFEDDKYLKSDLKGIGDIEKLVGKKEFPSMFQGLVIKPTGAPTLAPDDDKRPAIGDSIKEELAK